MNAPLFLVSLTLALACTAAPRETPASRVDRSTTDDRVTLFHNGRIYPSATAEPVQELVVRGGRVVGTSLQTAGLPAGTLVDLIDLQGGVAVPGLQDAHGHITSLGAALEEVQLQGSSSYTEVIDRIVAFASERPAGTWITGRGWDHTLWPGAEFPHHAELSRRTPEHPVLVRRVDGHAALANELALDRAGLLDGGPVPGVEGGRVHVDAEGRPTGVLIDTAMGLVSSAIARSEAGPAEARTAERRRILVAQRALLADGLVCIHDMGIGPHTAETLSELEDEGLLKLRVMAYLWGNDGLAPDVLNRYPRDRDREPAAKVRVVGSKLMMDGALGSRGAALLEPYADAHGETGLMRMDAATFATRVRELADAGLQPATHAIGDRANRVVLDTYAEQLAVDAGLRALRPRVEHAQVVSAADWARYDEHDIILSMQPTHATSDMRWAEERLGPERIAGAYAWRRLTREPLHLAFGSDFPVERPSPLEGLYAARTRQNAEGHPAGGWLPDQKLDGRAALAGFTSGAAFAVGEEDHRGHLELGSFCDMTVLDVDPVRCAPEDLLEARVLMTVIDGEVVYSLATRASLPETP